MATELQKIHAVLWKEIAQAFDDTADVTHAYGPDMTFRPGNGMQSVHVHFEADVWAVIRDAPDEKLKHYADNIAKVVRSAMRRYKNNSSSNAFHILIDDRGIDE